MAATSMSTASRSSSLSISSLHSSAWRVMCARQAPPPGTIPSAMPPRKAFTASSYLSFLSMMAASVGAPILMRATAPRSLTMRCSSRCTSNSLLALLRSASTWALRDSTALLTASSHSPVPTSSVLLFSTTARSSLPKSSSVVFTSFIPSSDVTSVAPVNVQMSSRNARRTSPRPGALTAATARTPRFRLSTRPESASPVTSPAMISSGDLSSTTFSRTGRISASVVIFWSVTSTRGASSGAICVSSSVMNRLDSQPTSISMPSVYSTESVRPCPSSKMVAPSSPTRSSASASRPPMSQSLHEMAAICWYCSSVVTGLAASLILPTKKRAALYRPLRSAIGLWPADTNLQPSRIIACVSTVAVVVPSPARESV
mmetsp:Transcript_24434/g.51158  ORF Transcript_24434/g.51158 Transcript_24434/m.51158 type:complete len:373 (-) Transcript_24434:381-1499(-)